MSKRANKDSLRSEGWGTWGGGTARERGFRKNEMNPRRTNQDRTHIHMIDMHDTAKRNIPTSEGWKAERDRGKMRYKVRTYRRRDHM